jgi:hypothetical protein
MSDVISISHNEDMVVVTEDTPIPVAGGDYLTVTTKIGSRLRKGRK